MPSKKAPRGFTYAVAPHMSPLPAAFPLLAKKFDVHLKMRRPSFAVDGTRNRDDQGRPTWDENTVPARDLMRYGERGWQVSGPIVDCPAALRALLLADPNGASLLGSQAEPTQAPVGGLSADATPRDLDAELRRLAV